MNKSFISSQQLNLNPNPIHSSEGLIESYKDNSKFLSLWDSQIKPIILSNPQYKGKVLDILKKSDYNDFLKTKKSDKTMNAEKYIEILKNKYSVKSKEDKENESIDKLKSIIGENSFKILETKASNLAKECISLQNKFVQNIKSNKKIKEIFNSIKIDYTKYLEPIENEQKIVRSILVRYLRDLNNDENKEKLYYIVYVVDMEKLRYDNDDPYDDLVSSGTDIYDEFYNCIPKYNSSKYEFDHGGWGWHAIHFSLTEK